MFWKIMLGLLLGGFTAAAVIGIAGVVYDWIQGCINRKSVQDHFAAKRKKCDTLNTLIKENLAKGNCRIINIGLTKAEAEIIDVSEKDGITYVAYEVEGERFGIRSSNGTSLSEKERLTLSL